MTPLNIRSFDAVPGSTDNTSALTKALAVARAQAQPLLIPAGVWAYSDLLNADGVQIMGEEGAVLHSLNLTRSAIYLRGVGAEIRGVRLSGVPAVQRSSANNSCRIVVEGSRFAIEAVTIDSGAGAAIMVTRASSEGRIAKCQLGNTLADSIHVTDKSSHITIEDNTIVNSGDDGIAVVGYRAQGSPPSQVIARRNTIRDNRGGRCMSVVGGSNVLYEDNEMSGNPGAAGIIIAQEASYKTFGSQRVIARFNTIRNCGNAAIGHYAVMIANSGEEPNIDITIARNVVVQDDARGGIRALGKLDQGVAIDENLILATPPVHIVTPGVVVKPFAGGQVGVR